MTSNTSFGCVDAGGFKTAGVHCDVRNKADGRLDLALLVSSKPCTVAGVFTQNRMAAAPVVLGRETLSKAGFARAIVINSGNANACTGKRGYMDCCKMQTATAQSLGIIPEEVFVCSTGRIGELLPMDRILRGIEAASHRLSENREEGLRAAEAILTSDTQRKVCTRHVMTSTGEVTISGMAKGAGMIEPNMATMLAFICTDAAVSTQDLQTALKDSVAGSFNAISVDGDQSTNDTVLLLANGVSEVDLFPEGPDWDLFTDALKAVCHDLAMKIVGDGEKITKVVEVSIEGASSPDEARAAARSIANSLLVKSSWYGNDPNWGRLIDALGYSGASVSESTIQLWYAADQDSSRIPVFAKGNAYRENKSKWKAIVSRKRFQVIAHLGEGTESCRVWSTDLTEGYVNFNKSE